MRAPRTPVPRADLARRLEPDPMGTLEASLEATRDLQDWMVDQRRSLHQIPELAYEEHATSAFLQARLGELGIPFETGFGGGTGIVATLGSEAGARRGWVALRADMDGLPIEETAEVGFKSRHAGAMHACGHDSHMAMLLGAARVLERRQAELPGPVRLIFQPAEEGGAGAAKMVAEGVLDGVERIFGLHVWPALPSGCVAIRDGAFLAASGKFELTIRGRGGHGAMPHLAVDPVVCFAAIVSGLQTIVSRERSPLSSNVVTVGAVHAGKTFNVIPDAVEVQGTLRSHSEEEQTANQIRIRELAQGIGAAHRCEVDVRFPGTMYPPTVNHGPAVEVARAVAREVVGDAGLVACPQTMGGEDFSFYAQRVSACFAALGIGDAEKGTDVSLHNPGFRVDEDVLATGAALHVGFALA